MNVNSDNSMPVNIIVAHALEAKALVSLLRLTRDRDSSSFVQYRNANQLHLLVTGMGKGAVRSGVCYLGERQSNDKGEVRAWLNVGIAGHRDAPLGSAWLGNKLTDLSTGSRAYPPQLVEGVPVGAVVTVDTPETAYPLDAAYDMEASAFYAEATKHSPAELVQTFKVISDNLANPISEIDLKSVPEMITQQHPQLVSLLEGLASLAKAYNSSQSLPDHYHELCLKIRLTVNQRLQLRRLCQRFKALGLEEQLPKVADLRGVDAKKILRGLTEYIDRISAA